MQQRPSIFEPMEYAEGGDLSAKSSMKREDSVPRQRRVSFREEDLALKALVKEVLASQRQTNRILVGISCLTCVSCVMTYLTCLTALKRN